MFCDHRWDDSPGHAATDPAELVKQIEALQKAIRDQDTQINQMRPALEALQKEYDAANEAAKEYDADVHKERIFGEHVAEYMRYLIEEDATKYKEHFKAWLDEEIEPDDIEEMYQDTHKKIREDPKAKPKAVFGGDKKKYKKVSKKTYEQRKADVEAKRATFEPDEEEDEEEDE